MIETPRGILFLPRTSSFTACQPDTALSRFEVEILPLPSPYLLEFPHSRDPRRSRGGSLPLHPLPPGHTPFAGCRGSFSCPVTALSQQVHRTPSYPVQGEGQGGGFSPSHHRTCWSIQSIPVSIRSQTLPGGSLMLTPFAGCRGSFFCPVPALSQQAHRTPPYPVWRRGFSPSRHHTCWCFPTPGFPDTPGGLTPSHSPALPLLQARVPGPRSALPRR